MSVASMPFGTVAKDGAFSQLFGSRVNALKGITTGTSVFKTVDIESATIANVTADTINGSSINIALINTNPNELLATNASTDFVSIPYGLTSTANSVPQRASAGSFTQFSSLSLTDATNQITASQSPNQVIVNAVAPAAARTYTLQLEGPSGGDNLVVTSTSGSTGFGFLGDSIAVTQMAIKAASGQAATIINSAAGFNSLLTTRSNLGSLWSVGNFDADDSFQINWVLVANSDYMKFDGTGVTTLKGHLLPTTVGGTLGTDAKRFNSVCLATGANTLTDVVTFTGVAIGPQAMRTIAVNNTRVTASCSIVCAVEGFDGTISTDGLPYAVINNIAVGSFDLNVFNSHGSNSIGGGITVLVRYWILPETS